MTLTLSSPLLRIAGIYLALLASPGPNFFILSQMALEGRRKQARYVVVGLTTSAVFWVALSLAGLAELVEHHRLISLAVRFLGAGYLVFYGCCMLASALKPAGSGGPSTVRQAAPETAAGAYRAGLLTGVTNPKSAAFWTSIFATLIPSNAHESFYVAAVLMVGAMSLLWNSGIAVIFGTAALRRKYVQLRPWVSGAAGSMLVALGLQRLFAP